MNREKSYRRITEAVGSQIHGFEEMSGQEEYKFLQGLIGLLRPERILEIGTSIGAGTLALAKAMSSGTVVTIDIQDLRSDTLLTYNGPVQIEFIKRNSAHALAELAKKGERFDLIFIDGGHHYLQVKADWDSAQKLSDTVIFHDVLQFQGVYRVVRQIRRMAEWDICVLDYPGITLTACNLLPYQSNRTPGLAIACRRKTPWVTDLSGLPGKPSAESKRAFNRWKETINVALSADSPQDLGKNDLEIIFHLLWSLKPEYICHTGHIGTAASFLFQAYADNKGIPFIGIDCVGFYQKKINRLPEELSGYLKCKIFTDGALMQFWKRQEFLRGLLWVDPWDAKPFYDDILPRMLSQMPVQTITAIRNFSPYTGLPAALGIDEEAECVNPNAHGFCSWLSDSGILDRNLEVMLAKPELVFGDYLNAGHWIYILKKE